MHDDKRFRCHHQVTTEAPVDFMATPIDAYADSATLEASQAALDHLWTEEPGLRQEITDTVTGDRWVRTDDLPTWVHFPAALPLLQT